MKRRDLVRKIGKEAKRRGVTWEVEREGGRHTVFGLGEQMVPVPRHNEIGEALARAIFIECESELGKGWWR